MWELPCPCGTFIIPRGSYISWNAIFESKGPFHCALFRFALPVFERVEGESKFVLEAMR